MPGHAEVRGASGRRTPPEFVPRRVVDQFPAAIWIPLSYQHPSRTWRIEVAGPRQALVYLKVSQIGIEAGVGDERERLLWAAGKLPVPSVIDAGDDDGMEWMVLGPLPGMDGSDIRLSKHREQLVRMLASSLRELHDAPTAACPFDFRLPVAMAHVENRQRSGLINQAEFRQEFCHHSAESAVAELGRQLPADEEPVITHGDYCVPNIVFDRGRLSGFVDLGDLGVADRWRDLAVATWSLERNIGPGWEDLFLRTYGVDPNPSRARFYRLLYELAS
jgi:aminoglycoside phosphotransferase